MTAVFLMCEVCDIVREKTPTKENALFLLFFHRTYRRNANYERPPRSFHIPLGGLAGVHAFRSLITPVRGVGHERQQPGGQRLLAVTELPLDHPPEHLKNGP